MSTTARIRPQALSLATASPAISTEGGLWVGPYHHHQPQDQPRDQQHQQHPPDHPAQQGHAHPHAHALAHQQLPASSAAEAFVFVDPFLNSSSSDLATPLTPTFSHHGGAHLRYASSASSLDLQHSFSACSDSPVSPTPPPPPLPPQNAVAASPVTTTTTSKRQLPDVQEEPLERDGDDEPTMTRFTERQLDSLYDCLCDSPCVHQSSDMMAHSADWTHSVDNDMSVCDYDMGFLSDGDADSGLYLSKQRSGVESPLNGLTMRLGTRFPTLSRWRSTKRRNRAFTAVSEPSLDFPPALSRATSTSRSSSLSAPSRKYLDRATEPPVPPTPALSFYGLESTDSITSAVAINIDRPEVRESIERERGLATTPLLPPLLTEPPTTSSANQSQHPSPLQSPTVAPQLSPELRSSAVCATPPLSARPSLSSFRPSLLTSMSSPVVATGEVVATIPNLLEPRDAWSDRLGHANYTILPRPYDPDAADLDTLRILRADWDLARVNYTKHIVRTGEHYGTTSKTYALTEAKWAETEREWKTAHDTLVGRVAALNLGTPDQLRWDRLQDDAPATVAVPSMLDAEGKFPDLGDEDIVGPMVRDAVMARDSGSDSENSAKKFWKSFAGKVGLKK